MEKIKYFFIALGTALSARIGLLATPVYLLVLLCGIDYFTGIAAAPYRGVARNSRQGLRGIVRKVCILLLVVLAAVVDWVLLYAAEQIGATPPFTFLIASATAIWLICNEIISILENIGDIGVSLPPFLRKAVDWLKKDAVRSLCAEDSGEAPDANQSGKTRGDSK